MAEKITVPTLGESVTEATVSKWLKSQGESVVADEPIVELETDKVNVEVPSPSKGVLESISVKEGETVNVGSLLGVINGAAKKSNTTPDNTANVLSQAMPLILGAMQRNAKTPQGAASLSNALSDPKHNGSMLDMLGGLFGDGPGSPEELEQDGAGILIMC